MKKVVDEEELYKQIMDKGFGRENHPVFQELLVVAKKVRQDKKFGEKKITEYLADFCLERNSNFNITLSEQSLIDVSRAAMRYSEFRKPNFPVYISSDEIERVKSVKDLKLQMLFLASLVYAKSSGNPQLFSDTTKDIREIIKLSGERYTVPKFIEELSPLARVARIFHHIKSKHQFYALIENPVGDVVLTISNLSEMESLSEIYRKYNGGFPSWCRLCGEEFLRQSYKHTKRLCPKCTSKT